MNDEYFSIEHIWTRYCAGAEFDVESEILEVLLREKIERRKDDGDLKQINISRPTSIPNCYVVGLRYIKNDGTQTEDHFLFQKGKPIAKFYRRNLEKVLSEYTGAHKMQVPLSPAATAGTTTTYVNTVTFIKGNF